jgi:hypothetical protein
MIDTSMNIIPLSRAEHARHKREAQHSALQPLVADLTAALFLVEEEVTRDEMLRIPIAGLYLVANGSAAVGIVARSLRGVSDAIALRLRRGLRCKVLAEMLATLKRRVDGHIVALAS